MSIHHLKPLLTSSSGSFFNFHFNPNFILATSPSKSANQDSIAPPPTKPEVPFARFVIYGLVTAVYEVCGGHTFEFLKVVKQTTPDSYFSIIKVRNTNWNDVSW